MAASLFASLDFTASTVVKDPDDSSLDTSVYEVTGTKTVLPGNKGVDVTYTIKNISTTSRRWPHFHLPVPNLSYVAHWYGRHKWQRFTSPVPWDGSSSIIEIIYGLGPPNGATFNCCAFDDGTNIIGIGTDYPYVSDFGAFFFYDNTLVFIPGVNSINVPRVVPDWLRPGETKTIRFWFRDKVGITVQDSLDVVEPYSDFMIDNFPMSHPPRLGGRVYCLQAADEHLGGVAAHRHWYEFGGKTLDLHSSWKDYLNGFVNQYVTGGFDGLHENGYKALMIWRISGWANTVEERAFKCFDDMTFVNKPDSLEGLDVYNFYPGLSRMERRDASNLFTGNAVSGYVLNQTEVENIVDGLELTGTQTVIHCYLYHPSFLSVFDTNSPGTSKSHTLDAMKVAIAALRSYAATYPKNIKWSWFPFGYDYLTVLNYKKDPAPNAAAYATWRSRIQFIRDNVPNITDIMDFSVPFCNAVYGDSYTALEEYDLFAVETSSVFKEMFPSIPCYMLVPCYYDDSQPWSGRPLHERQIQQIFGIAYQTCDGIIAYNEPNVSATRTHELNVPNLASLLAVTNGSFYFRTMGVGGLLTGLNFTGVGGTIAGVASYLQTQIRSFVAALPSDQKPFDVGDVVSVSGSGSTLIFTPDATTTGTSYPEISTQRLNFYIDGTKETTGTALVGTGLITHSAYGFGSQDPEEWIKWAFGGTAGGSFPARTWWTSLANGSANVVFEPSIWSSLPENLKATAGEILAWQAETGIRLLLWCGVSVGAYQSSGFGSKVLSSLSAGTYRYTMPADWQPWTLKPEALEQVLNQNFFPALQYVSGLGLDAMPSVANDPWALDVMAQIRARFPQKFISSETHKEDRSYSLCPPFYSAPGDNTPAEGDVGEFQGRCPLLEVIYPGYEPWVGLNTPFDDAEARARIAFVEQHGGVVCNFGALSHEPYVPYDFGDEGEQNTRRNQRNRRIAFNQAQMVRQQLALSLGEDPSDPFAIY